MNEDRFFDRLLDRNHLCQRTRETKQMVVSITEALKIEQEYILIHDPDNFPVPAPGSELIEIWATRYSDHPEYQQDWVPQ